VHDGPGFGPETVRAAYAVHTTPELYRFALRLGDEGAAQEVVQEVFLRAWRRSDSFDPSVASPRVWLFAIARNAVIDEARRGRRPAVTARPNGARAIEPAARRCPHGSSVRGSAVSTQVASADGGGQAE
jgi:RNA polymerase sigma-70 factor (ECF subfamily)